MIVVVSLQLTPVPYSGINLRDNGKAVLPNITKNFYLPDLLTSKAEQVIKNANPSKPFYLYFATPVPHTAVEGYTPILHTMPKYQLRHAAHSFSDNYPQRKKYLGKDVQNPWKRNFRNREPLRFVAYLNYLEADTDQSGILKRNPRATLDFEWLSSVEVFGEAKKVRFLKRAKLAILKHKSLGANLRDLNG